MFIREVLCRACDKVPEWMTTTRIYIDMQKLPHWSNRICAFMLWKMNFREHFFGIYRNMIQNLWFSCEKRDLFEKWPKFESIISMQSVFFSNSIPLTEWVSILNIQIHLEQSSNFWWAVYISLLNSLSNAHKFYEKHSEMWIKSEKSVDDARRKGTHTHTKTEMHVKLQRSHHLASCRWKLHFSERIEWMKQRKRERDRATKRKSEQIKGLTFGQPNCN